MPRDIKDFGAGLPGKLTDQNRTDIIKKENASFRKDSIGKFFPTFRKSAELFGDLDNEDTVNYLKIFCAICDTASTQYLGDLAIEAVQRYHKIGHYDEVVAAQQTAFDLAIKAMFDVFSNCIPMEMLHDYLSNPPTDETNDTTLGDGTQANTKISLFSRDTLATQYLDMERSGVLVVPGIIDMMKKIFFVVKQFDEEKIGSVYSPGSYFMYGVPHDKLTDWVTNIAVLTTNAGKLKKYCNMFGIPLVKFSAKMMDHPYTVYNSWDNLDLDIWSSTQRFSIYDGGAINQMYPLYNQSTTHWALYFKNNPDEAYERHILNKFCLPYDASYNKWGGLMSIKNSTAIDGTNIVSIFQDDNSQGAANGFSPIEVVTSPTEITKILFRLAGAYQQTNTLNATITGTELAAATYDVTESLYHHWRGFKKYGLFKNTLFDNVIVEWFANVLKLTNVKKNNFSSTV